MASIPAKLIMQNKISTSYFSSILFRDHGHSNYLLREKLIIEVIYM